MRRFRVVIAGLVVVAMFSFGAAACTPEQQSVTNPVNVFFNGLVYLIVLYSSPYCTVRCE